VCIVTASTLGIGLAIATRLAEEGGSIVISSRKQAQVDIVVSELKAKVV
jgi:dehydrogenase/reductase SDR family protein 4